MKKDHAGPTRPTREILASLRQVLEFLPDDRSADSVFYVTLRLFSLEMVFKAAAEYVEWRKVENRVALKNLRESVQLAAAMRKWVSRITPHTSKNLNDVI